MCVCVCVCVRECACVFECVTDPVLECLDESVVMGVLVLQLGDVVLLTVQEVPLTTLVL